VFAIVLECVPDAVARMVTDSVPVPTIGIGAGRHCDGQVLVYHDILGFEDRVRPKFVRRYAEQALWVLWSRSGDDAVDALMQTGIEQMQAQQFQAAIATFSEVIRRKPSFAEGWNKRATVLFMAGELKRSLADCDEVVKRNPNHFGALAGYGQIYFQLEQYEKAIDYWKRALEVNPNMDGVEAGIKSAEQLLAERRKKLGVAI